MLSYTTGSQQAEKSQLSILERGEVTIDEVSRVLEMKIADG